MSEFAFAPGAASPRKRPAQDRSRATVDAILGACIRILQREGAELTTTQVAQVAGVSVGTLYQYFPNREALIHGVLAEHAEHAISALERAVEQARSLSPERAAEHVTRAFLAAKAERADVTLVLHHAFGWVDDRPVVRAASRRAARAIATLLPIPDAEARARVLCSALEGVVHGAIVDDPAQLLDPRWIDQVVAIVISIVRSYLPA